jgi:hypothetical protein
VILATLFVYSGPGPDSLKVFITRRRNRGPTKGTSGNTNGPVRTNIHCRSADAEISHDARDRIGDSHVTAGRRTVRRVQEWLEIKKTAWLGWWKCDLGPKLRSGGGTGNCELAALIYIRARVPSVWRSSRYQRKILLLPVVVSLAAGIHRCDKFDSSDCCPISPSSIGLCLYPIINMHDTKLFSFFCWDFFLSGAAAEFCSLGTFV